jgi:hypothetical protein
LSSNPFIASGDSVAFGAPPFLLRCGGGETDGELSGAAVGVSFGSGVCVDAGVGVSVASGPVLDFLFLDFGEAFSPIPDFSSDFAAGDAELLVFARGEAVGEGDDFLGDPLTEGDDVSFFVLVLFFFFRAGVGVGVEKTFLIVSPIVCSASTGVTTDVIRSAVIIKRAKVTPGPTRSARDFLKDGLVDTNSGVKIFEWKIFVG